LMTERGHATHVLLAPDKFKGSLTAAEVAEALAAGMAEVLPQLETAMLPVADGGDGTVAAALSAGFDKITVDAIARPERRGCGVRPTEGRRAGGAGEARAGLAALVHDRLGGNETR
jgi:Glycerate kinase family